MPPLVQQGEFSYSIEHFQLKISNANDQAAGEGAGLPSSCISSESCQQFTHSCQTVASQETP